MPSDGSRLPPQLMSHLEVFPTEAPALWSRDKPLPTCLVQTPHQQNTVVASRPYVWSGFYAAVVTARNEVIKIVTNTRNCKI